MKQAITKRFIMADILEDLSHLKLGTLLRQYSDQIGFPFQNEKMYFWHYFGWQECNKIGEVENLVFEVMKTMAIQFGLKSSLHDIPNVFANGFVEPRAQFFPLHSICTAGNIHTMRLVIRS